MTNGKGQSKSLAALTLSMILFGTIGICRRLIPLPSDVVACGRGIMGGLFLLLFMKARGQKISLGQIRLRQFLLLVLSGALMGLNWILLFEAYNYTTVAVATLCYYMAPVIVILLSPVILKETLDGRQIFCVAASMTGMVLVSGVAGGTAPGSPRGVVLGLGAAVLYASVVMLNKLITGIPAFGKTIVQLFSAAVTMLPYLAVSGSLHAYELPVSGTVLFLVVGIVHTGVAYVMYFASIEHLPARTCALMSYIDPVTAVILSALFLQEPMGVPEIAGTVMIIGSAVYCEGSRGNERLNRKRTGYGKNGHERK